MFSIIWGSFMTIGKGIRDHRIRKENEKRRKQYINQPYYIDSMGQTRLTSNNHLCDVSYAITGYQVIKDIEANKVVYNEKELIRNSEIEKKKESAKLRGASTYRIDIHRHPENYLDGEPIGHVYQDFNNGNNYIIRVVSFHSYSFGLFINIETGMAERYTDYTLNFIDRMERNKGVLGDLFRKNMEEYKRMYGHNIINQWNIENMNNKQKVLYSYFGRNIELERLEENTEYNRED